LDGISLWGISGWREKRVFKLRLTLILKRREKLIRYTGTASSRGNGSCRPHKGHQYSDLTQVYPGYIF